jgi:hypothetical protein
MPFYTLQPDCPVCPIVLNRRGNKINYAQLILIESNYSGCGVDIAECPNCKKVFQISYKIDEIQEVNNESNN